MTGIFKEQGEQINHISDGMTHAIEERMKSERFKTELITNVSHDIKTPLTSIINYVDLLEKEELHNETAQEYLEVLERQSSRLKKLIEDLIELPRRPPEPSGTFRAVRSRDIYDTDGRGI